MRKHTEHTRPTHDKVLESDIYRQSIKKTILEDTRKDLEKLWKEGKEYLIKTRKNTIEWHEAALFRKLGIPWFFRWELRFKIDDDPNRTVWWSVIGNITNLYTLYKWELEWNRLQELMHRKDGSSHTIVIQYVRDPESNEVTLKYFIQDMWIEEWDDWEEEEEEEDENSSHEWSNLA